jgi:3'(2'), 5'-bisphosphate nucleotidase
VWIVDPVDGTREYGEERADWAVHVGLAVDGAPVLGAVALPGAGLVLCDPCPERCRRLPKSCAWSSAALARREATEVAERLGAELVPMGSAGAKAMAIVLGEADIYLHSGGQYEWDSCAPARWRWRMAFTVRGSMEARWSTTRPMSTCPTC